MTVSSDNLAPNFLIKHHSTYHLKVALKYLKLILDIKNEIGANSENDH